MLGSLVRLALPPVVWAVGVVVWYAVIIVREVGIVSFGLPQNARLVPESVFRHGRFWGPFEFGLEMGTGVRTYVTSGLPYVLVPMIALFAGWLPALVGGLGFGLGRTIMTATSLRYSRDGEWDLAFDRSAPVIRLVLLTAFTVAMAAVLLGLR